MWLIDQYNAKHTFHPFPWRWSIDKIDLKTFKQLCWNVWEEQEYSTFLFWALGFLRRHWDRFNCWNSLGMCPNASVFVPPTFCLDFLIVDLARSKSVTFDVSSILTLNWFCRLPIKNDNRNVVPHFLPRLSCYWFDQKCWLVQYMNVCCTSVQFVRFQSWIYAFM